MSHPVPVAIVLAAVGLLGTAPLAAQDPPAAQEPVASDDRPFVRGGIYDKPFFGSAGNRISVGGYADAQFRYEREEGFLDEMTFSLARINLFVFSAISERARVAFELEFEEGGEEIKVELAIIDFEIHRAFTFRAGIILAPLGRFNLAHDSPTNELTDRPLVSTLILGATLSETGMGFFGAFSPTARSRITYEAYAVNGLHDGIILDDGDGTRLSAGKNNFEDNNSYPSLVSRVALSPTPAGEVGLSVQTGPYNQWREGGLSVDERRDATVFAADGELDWRRLRLSGEYARAWIDVPAQSAVFQSNQQGIYVELSGSFLDGAISTLPRSVFRATVRADFVDFDMDSDGDSVRRLTVGVNFRPMSGTVFKLDWQRDWSLDPFDNEENAAAFLFSLATYF